MKTLYVHIGTPKTATTAIQNFCYDNQNILEEKGYAYPIFPYVYPEIGKQRNGHFLVGVYYEKDGSENDLRAREIFREGLAHIRQLFQTQDQVVVSDELIWRATHKRRDTLWMELKEEAESAGYQVKVIVYLRRQDQFLSSWWNQTVKMGRTPREAMSWEEYRERIPEWMQLNYYEKLESIASIIGKEQIIVRRFQRSSFVGGTIYSDFLDGIGLSMTEEYQAPRVQVNDGLKGNYHEVKRALNTLSMDRDSNLFFRQILSDCITAYPDTFDGELFSQEESLKFRERYREGNEKIVEEYLKEPGKALFEQTNGQKPKWEEENPYRYQDLVRFTGMAIMEIRKEMREREKIQEVQQQNSIQELKNSIKKSLRHPVRTAEYYLRRKSQ